MKIDIEQAGPRDQQNILDLIAACGLPEAGLRHHLDAAVVARADDRIVACASLELYGDGALLRSVAVAHTMRGSGVGRRIVQAALALANERGAASVYLLTTTAEHFFPKFGFAPVSRDEVPPGVRQSVEFQSACPASAVVMGLAAPRIAHARADCQR